MSAPTRLVGVKRKCCERHQSPDDIGGPCFPAISCGDDRKAHRNKHCYGGRVEGAPVKDVLGLEIVMDQGWIATFSAPTKMSPQVSVAVEGGSRTPVPDISIEVDDLDEALRRVTSAGIAIEYGPAVEHWGVRRFYVRDPFGRLINILTHA
jgi:catechol 2,3-dioxygenase-like lactoylglutathione lyase family enzyme